jgi:hypothetical protein
VDHFLGWELRWMLLASFDETAQSSKATIHFERDEWLLLSRLERFNLARFSCCCATRESTFGMVHESRFVSVQDAARHKTRLKAKSSQAKSGPIACARLGPITTQQWNFQNVETATFRRRVWNDKAARKGEAEEKKIDRRQRFKRISACREKPSRNAQPRRR